jgi:peptidoglycan/LPS O-acetylase OafA/YrhL
MMKSNRFEALDGLRGICAIMLVLYHNPFDSTLTNSAFVHHAWLFVDFFFVLSGFVIFEAYRNRVTDINSSVMFLIRRIGRIWPLHATVLVAFIFIEILKNTAIFYGYLNDTAFGGENTIFSIFKNFFLVHSWNTQGGLSWNYPSWSISSEFGSYIAFVVLMMVFGQIGLRLSFITFAATAFVVYQLSPATLNKSYDLGLLRCFSGFMLGILMHIIRCRFQIFRTVGTYTEWLILLCTIAAATMLGSTTFSHLVPLFFAAAVLVFSYENGFLSKILVSSSMQLLGKLSYSIYMTHAFIIYLIVAICKALVISHIVEITMFGSRIVLPESGQNYIGITFLLATTLGVSMITYQYIEMPSQKYFAKLKLTQEKLC